MHRFSSQPLPVHPGYWLVPGSEGGGDTHGFYNRLFLVEKSSGGWQPVIDLSPLNEFVHQTPFRRETSSSVLLSFQKGDLLALLAPSVSSGSAEFPRVLFYDGVQSLRGGVTLAGRVCVFCGRPRSKRRLLLNLYSQILRDGVTLLGRAGFLYTGSIVTKDCLGWCVPSSFRMRSPFLGSSLYWTRS